VLDNTLVLSGVVHQQPSVKISPAGIPHCHFVLEHQSIQMEAGLSRKAWCRIKVAASGNELKAQTEMIYAGCTVRVTGFINRIESSNGLAQLVLHATSIQRLD
jgi:primosomal replication protein N